MTPDEPRIKSEKRAGRREAVKIRQNAARLDEERPQETERYLAAQALVNSEDLAGKAVVRAFMLMKHEAFHVVFSDVATEHPPHSIGGALSMSSVTSTPSGCPPLEPNMPVSHAPTLGAHTRMGGVLSRFCDLHPTLPGSAGPAIDLNRTTTTRHTTPACAKKPHCISTANMTTAVNLFEDMPEQAPAPIEDVMAHPTCQFSLSVGSSASQKLVMADAHAGFLEERWRGHHA
jgi:hypothetical protein